MTSDITHNATGNPPDGGQRATSKRLLRTGIVLAVLALGAAGGAGASHLIQKSRPQSVLLLQPAPIAQMKVASPVAVKGQVAEVFGNKFIIQDASGRMLVDTGPRGETATPLAKDETVTVQGEFDKGFIHASVMTRADGSSEAFGPPNQPRSEPGAGERHGPPADCGPGAAKPPQPAP